ncbi:MAG TPA: M1 family metallopeptidase [Myxococcaceae bacterium]
MRSLLLGALVALVPACASTSQAPPASTSAPGSPAPDAGAADAGLAPVPLGERPIFRLPVDVHPMAQRVMLDVDPERETYRGAVEIRLRLDVPRRDLWVSARGLRLEHVLALGAGEPRALRAELDDLVGVAHLSADGDLPAGEVTIRIEFASRFETQLVGLFRLKTPAGWAAFTQFWQLDARRAFPCLDEPGFKIPWDVELTVPAGRMAFGNTPVMDERLLPDGRKAIRFAATRPLPSYLVAFAVGSFDVASASTLRSTAARPRPVEIRGIAPGGRGADLRYALEVAPQLLARLEGWFDLPYPYEKLDHLAQQDHAFGAMENAGLITYAERALLLRENEASDEDRRRVAETIAHESSHQWFGDWVTARWWEDLWLSESFATFVATEVVSGWRPALGSRISALEETLEAMRNDELEGSRPIRTTMHTEGDLRAWDVAVLYPKGAAVLGMFEALLGPEAFRAGIRRYLRDHADGNAATEDLVSALSDRPAVGTAFRTFLDQPGVPLVRGTLRCDADGARLELRQERAMPVGSRAAQLRWQVPICVRADSRRDPICTVLESETATLALSSARCPRWVHLNAGARGYYRWLLPPQGVDALLGRGWSALEATERLSAADAVLSAGLDGVLPADQVLSRTSRLLADSEPAVAGRAVEFLGRARLFWSPPQGTPALQAFLRAQLRPVLHRLGWTPRKGEPPRTSRLRAEVVELLALQAGDPEVLAHAAGLGQAWLGSDGRVHPEAVASDLRDTAARAAARAGDAVTFETFWTRLQSADDAATRDTLVGALASFLQPDLVTRARSLLLGPELRSVERQKMLQVQAKTPELRADLEAWMIEHQEALAARFAEVGQQELPKSLLGCSPEEARVIGDGFEPLVRSVPSMRFQLRKAEERARVCGAVREVQAPAIEGFLAARPAAGERAIRH